MRVLIIGCGYVGLPLGAQLVRDGHDVFGMRRTVGSSAELTAAGIKPLTGDITKPEGLAQLPAAYDWVVNCVSSSHGNVEDYRAVYSRGMPTLIEWLGPAPPQKFVYTSSTAVYGQTDASMVEETSPTEPEADTARVLVETEKVLIEAAPKFPGVILRVAGIYGPERGSWFKQYLKGEAKLEGKGERILNMIHLDDVIGAIVAALKGGRPGQVYNVVDNEPVTQLDYFRWLSNRLGKPLPPSAPDQENAERKRVLTSKKVSNRKLKTQLGYRLKFPSFREGYEPEILRLGLSG